MTAKLRSISIDDARAQRAAGLVNDFMMQRVREGWSILLLEVGESQSLVAVSRKENHSLDEEACIFPNADAALAAVYEIGFDIVSRALGIWRHDPKHMERLLHEAKEVLRRTP